LDARIWESFPRYQLFRPSGLQARAADRSSILATYRLAKTENTDSETPLEGITGLRDGDGLTVSDGCFLHFPGYIGLDSPYTSYTWMSIDGNTCRITLPLIWQQHRGFWWLTLRSTKGSTRRINTLGAPADGDSVITIGGFVQRGQNSFSSVGIR
jgi:hypothetical protein